MHKVALKMMMKSKITYLFYYLFLISSVVYSQDTDNDGLSDVAEGRICPAGSINVGASAPTGNQNTTGQIDNIYTFDSENIDVDVVISGGNLSQLQVEGTTALRLQGQNIDGGASPEEFIDFDFDFDGNNIDGLQFTFSGIDEGDRVSIAAESSLGVPAQVNFGALQSPTPLQGTYSVQSAAAGGALFLIENNNAAVRTMNALGGSNNITGSAATITSYTTGNGNANLNASLVTITGPIENFKIRIRKARRDGNVPNTGNVTFLFSEVEYCSFDDLNNDGIPDYLDPCFPNNTAAPSVISPVNLLVGDTATPLTATGESGATFLWYTSLTGGVGSVTAPTPDTSASGTTSYFVSQTVNSCESSRAEIQVIVNDPPTTTNVTNANIFQNAGATTLSNPIGADSDGTVVSYEISSIPPISEGILQYTDDVTGNVITVIGTEILSVTEANSLTFNPNPNFDGDVTFGVASIDNQGAQDPTPAIFTIPVRVPPTLSDVVEDTPENTSITETPVLNGTPVGAVTYTISGGPSCNYTPVQNLHI